MIRGGNRRSSEGIKEDKGSQQKKHDWGGTQVWWWVRGSKKPAEKNVAEKR